MRKSRYGNFYRRLHLCSAARFDSQQRRGAWIEFFSSAFIYICRQYFHTGQTRRRKIMRWHLFEARGVCINNKCMRVSERENELWDKKILSAAQSALGGWLSNIPRLPRAAIVKRTTGGILLMSLVIFESGAASNEPLRRWWWRTVRARPPLLMNISIKRRAAPAQYATRPKSVFIFLALFLNESWFE